MSQLAPVLSPDYKRLDRTSSVNIICVCVVKQIIHYRKTEPKGLNLRKNHSTQTAGLNGSNRIHLSDSYLLHGSFDESVLASWKCKGRIQLSKSLKIIDVILFFEATVSLGVWWLCGIVIITVVVISCFNCCNILERYLDINDLKPYWTISWSHLLGVKFLHCVDYIHGCTICRYRPWCNRSLLAKSSDLKIHPCFSLKIRRRPAFQRTSHMFTRQRCNSPSVLA